MKKILISGGAGYLGTVLTMHLLKKYTVIVYDEFNFNWIIKNKKKIPHHNRLFFIKKNILNVQSKDFRNIDIVCDLNGIPNDPSSELNKKYTWKINYYGRKNFASVAKKSGVKRYIFNSTCAVFGHNKKLAYEKTKKKPLSTYAKANLAAEKNIFQKKSEEFKVNVLRNSTLYGFSPAMRLDLVINSFVYTYFKEKKIYINGDGNQWRPFLSINDVCKIYSSIIESNKPSFICNLVSFNSKIRNLANLVCKKFGISSKIIKYNRKNFDKRNYKVGSHNFRKYFRNLKFTSLNKDILNLKNSYKKFKIKKGVSTIRMLYYKKKLS